MPESRSGPDELTSQTTANNQNEPHYSKHDVERVASTLPADGNGKWSNSPRLYIILRDIGQLELLDGLIELGISDTWLPITSEKLLRGLLPVTAIRGFLHAQLRVCVKPADFRLGNGARHGHFAPATNPPLVQGREIGEGHLGTVDEVVSERDGKVYARKSIRRRTSWLPHHSQIIQAYQREVQVLRRIRHKHCVQFAGSYTTSDNLVIIMSPLADSNLAEYLARAGQTFERSLVSPLRHWFGCLATAVHYLHSNKIRHRDIKPANILVCGNRVLLVDFDLALDWTDSTSSTTIALVGSTPLYAAPEIVLGDKRNSSSDIWCLGCVFLEMATVLKGKSVSEQRAFFTAQADNTHFVNNKRGIVDWTNHLIGLSNSDNEPLRWASEMLCRDGERRLKSAALLELINTHTSPRGTNEYFGECCRPTSMIVVAASSKRHTCTSCNEKAAGMATEFSPLCVQCLSILGGRLHRNPQFLHRSLQVSRMLSLFFPGFMFRHLNYSRLQHFKRSLVWNNQWGFEDLEVPISCLPRRPLHLRLRTFVPSSNLVSIQQDPDTLVIDARNSLPVGLFRSQRGRLPESLLNYLNDIVDNHLMEYSSFLLQFCKGDLSSRVLHVLLSWFQFSKNEMPSKEVLLMKTAIQLIAIHKICEQALLLEEIPESLLDEFFHNGARPHRYSSERQSPLLVNLQVKVTFHEVQRALLKQVLSGFDRLLSSRNSWPCCLFIAMCLAFVLERIEEASLKFHRVARQSDAHELSTMSDVESYCDDVEGIVFQLIYRQLSANIRAGIIETNNVGSEMVNLLIHKRSAFAREVAQGEVPHDSLLSSRLVLSLLDLVEYV